MLTGVPTFVEVNCITIRSPAKTVTGPAVKSDDETYCPGAEKVVVVVAANGTEAISPVDVYGIVGAVVPLPGGDRRRVKM
jgi:hypothetical protein